MKIVGWGSWILWAVFVVVLTASPELAWVVSWACIEENGLSDEGRPAWVRVESTVGFETLEEAEVFLKKRKKQNGDCFDYNLEEKESKWNSTNTLQ